MGGLKDGLGAGGSGEQVELTTQLSEDTKLEFRDTGIFINSGANGKLTISSDGAGTDDITLTGTLVIDNDITQSGDSLLATDKKVQFRDTALYIHSTADGQLDIVADTTVAISGALTADSTFILTGDFTLSGHKQAQVFTANGFNFPLPGTDWTPELNGAGLGASLTAKTCWIRLGFLKVGDEIVSYKIKGDCTEAAALTLDCKLVTIDNADPITTDDVTGGGIVQVTANGIIDVTATLGAVETVAVETQYVLEITGTTGAGDAITIIGAEVTVNRK